MSKKLMYLAIFALVAGFVNNAAAELVGHWRFDEGTGDTANDSSGYGNHGTLIDSVQWDVGQIGGAVKFDGTPGYVQIPHGDNLKLINQGDFTITMWFMQDEVTDCRREGFERSRVFRRILRHHLFPRHPTPRCR